MQTVLVTVDALRADHLGQYGYERNTMPVLGEMFETGTRFENAFANGPFTRVSIPSMMTSRHLAYKNIDQLPTVASILEGSDVRTAVIGTQTGIGLGLIEGNFGFGEVTDLGEGAYYEQANAPETKIEWVGEKVDAVATRVSNRLRSGEMDRLYRALEAPYNALFGAMQPGFQYNGYTSAEEVTDRASQWVRAHADEPFFLWVHYMEGHRPYGVHDENPAYLDGPVSEERIRDLMKTAGTAPVDVTDEEHELMVDLYDSDLRYCSRHLSRLHETLQEVGIYDDAAVMFSSDHGEEFREHGSYFHGNYPYDELIHVPLLAKLPDETMADTVSEQRELLDVTPTITALHDIDPSDYDFHGRPLFEEWDRLVFSLGQPSKPGEGDSAVAVRTTDWKYIHSDETRQLYDHEADPGETNDVLDEHPDVAEELRDDIPDNLLRREPTEPRPPENTVDRKHLEALGYMEVRNNERQ